MHIDVMVGTMTWKESADLAVRLEGAGFSGMLFTETSQVPWMSIAAAATAAPTLEFSTGIAVAFPRSPMIAAQVAWELARNTGGRFRLGLGSQVRGHIVRRYSARWDKPAPQMRDYVAAFQACIRAFRGEERLAHSGPYYDLSLLSGNWAPPRHEFEDVKVDISAVGPFMCRVAGELCDGLHVHPMHSLPYIENRLLPAVAEGAARSGRSKGDVDLIVPRVRDRRRRAGGTRPEGAAREDSDRLLRLDAELCLPVRGPRLSRHRAEAQPAHARRGPRGDGGDGHRRDAGRVRPWWRAGTTWRMPLVARYAGVAERVVLYLALDDVSRSPSGLDRWGEVARAVRAA